MRSGCRAAVLAGLVFVTSVGVVLGSSPAWADGPIPFPGQLVVPSDAANLYLSGQSAGAVSASIAEMAGGASSADAAATILAGTAAAAPETLGVSLVVGLAITGGMVLYDRMGPTFNPDADVTSGQGPFTVSEYWTWGHPPGPVGVQVQNTSSTGYYIRFSMTCDNGGGYTSPIVFALPMDYAPAGTNYACSDPVSGTFTATSFSAVQISHMVGGVAVPWSNPHPARHLQGVTHCIMVSGGSPFDVTSTSDAFLEASSSTSPGLSIGKCPTGAYPTGVDVNETTPDGSAATKVIGTAATGAGATVGGVFTANPSCASTRCVLDLLRLNYPTTGARTDCFGHGTLCQGWSTLLTRADSYVCTYGGVDVALSECSAYAPTFDPVTQGTTTTAPLPDPSRPPGSDPVPEPGSGSVCDMSWTDLLTGLVVLKAGECALHWAFVPPAGTFQTDLGSVQATWVGSPVGSFTGAMRAPIGAIGDTLVDGGNCLGPSFTFPMPAGAAPVLVHPIAACTTPMSTVASTTKTILTVFVLVGAALLGQRLILSSLGMPYLWWPSSPTAPEQLSLF